MARSVEGGTKREEWRRKSLGAPSIGAFALSMPVRLFLGLTFQASTTEFGPSLPLPSNRIGLRIELATHCMVFEELGTRHRSWREKLRHGGLCFATRPIPTLPSLHTRFYPSRCFLRYTIYAFPPLIHSSLCYKLCNTRSISSHLLSSIILLLAPSSFSFHYQSFLKPQPIFHSFIIHLRTTICITWRIVMIIFVKLIDSLLSSSFFLRCIFACCR